MWQIYVLIDPITKLPRYVGQTFRALDLRVDEHLRPCHLIPHTHKNCWLRSLVRTGLKPGIESLETCESREDANRAEIFWILYWRLVGARLTNATKGGDGQSKGYQTSEQTRIKISNANKGRTISKKHRARISHARKGIVFSTSHRIKISQARQRYFENPTAAKNKNGGTPRAIIDERGIVYPTIQAAIKALNIGRTSAWKALNGKSAHVGGHRLRYV